MPAFRDLLRAHLDAMEANWLAGSVSAPDPSTRDVFGEDEFALAFTRIGNHYFTHAARPEEG